MIYTRTHKTWMRDDGIIQSDVLPDAEIHLQDAIDSVRAGASLAGDKKRPVLVKFGQIKSIDRKAREYLSSKETEGHSLAIALIINSSIGRVIGNFMIGLNKTPYPTRLFTSEDEAVHWLKGFL